MRAFARLSPLLVLWWVSACEPGGPDAYGNFEAREVTVSSELEGKLLALSVEEGELLEAGEPVGLVDTVSTSLRLKELEALRRTAAASTGQAEAEARALEAEYEAARMDFERTRRLHDDSAATSRQLERATAAVRALGNRVAAARRAIEAGAGQSSVVEAQIAQLRDRLARSRIVNPVRGTVLETYARVGEFVRPGQPVYRIAGLDTLTLRVYVDGAQLARIGLGDRASIRTGSGESSDLTGTVTWIASEAEFTPTPIQTRDERADLVYALELRVPNPDGRLRIGMPADVDFASSP